MSTRPRFRPTDALLQRENRTTRSVKNIPASRLAAIGTLRSALVEAAPLPFPTDWIVESLLDDDSTFARAYARGLDSLDRADRRGHLPAKTGAVAESVAARLFVDNGFELVAQLIASGARGVDLLLLTPAGNVLALEVKGTLRRGTLPRMRRGRSRQMSAAWLDGVNDAMQDWDLRSADVYSAVVVIDLAAGKARVAVSGDHEAYEPVAALDSVDVVLEAPPARTRSSAR